MDYRKQFASLRSDWGGISDWEQVGNRFLLGADENHPAGSLGGEEVHTLTEDEMPSHKHMQYIDCGNVGWANRGYYGQTAGIETSWTTPLFSDIYNGQSHLYNNGNQYTMNGAGGNQPHNNVPQYRAVWIWRRIK